ncbi:MAG: hypothetical protein AAGI49_09525 [Bacteroidota bacterium]
MKSFKHWKRQEVQDTFGLERVFQMPSMDEWLSVEHIQLTEYEQSEIQQLRRELERYSPDWNEAAIKFLFLGPLIRLVDFHVGPYNPFLEHSLSATVGTATASGKVDFMIAKGEQIPETPFFCLHEYKPEEGTSNDPYGQLLIAMVAAQQANEAIGITIPIYGMYSLGNIFYFVLLEDKKYMRSQSFDAITDEIFAIFKILRKSKIPLEQMLNKQAS